MSSVRKRVVLDTNVLVSAAIYPNSASGAVYAYVAAFCTLCASESTRNELAAVLMRDKFDRYFPETSVNYNPRQTFLSLYDSLTETVELTHIATACTDPKDNPFLSVAVSAGAQYLITGDKKHLLPMNPYHGVEILSEQQFLALLI
jgi:uncharacterized protein